jgi:hypothetical protein
MTHKSHRFAALALLVAAVALAVTILGSVARGGVQAGVISRAAPACHPPVAP